MKRKTTILMALAISVLMLTALLPMTAMAADDLQPIPGMPQNGNTVIAQPELTIDPDAVFDPDGVLFDSKYGFPARLGYRTVTEYYAESNYLALKYPDLVKKHVIGQSYEGVPIIALEISSAPGSNDGRPGTMHIAGSTGREWPSTELALNTMWYLVTQYGADDRVTELLDTTTCWFVPAVNPDGVHYDQKTNPGTWRKNRRFNGGTSYGVDIARNWPFGWGSGNGSASSTTSDNYRGAAPKSEKEVQAVTGLFENNQVITSISGRTSGQLIIYAWGHKFNQPGTNPIIAQLGRDMANYNMHADQYYETLYASNGVFDDYAFGAMRSLSFTLFYFRSNVPNYNGTNIYMAYAGYNDLFHGTQRSFPVTYSSASNGRAPANNLTAPVGYVDDPNLFRTGYGGVETIMTVAKVNALPGGALAGKIFISPHGSSNTVTRDIILAAQAKGAVGVLLCGASSGNYSGGYAHYTPNFGTAGIDGINIPVAGTNKGHVRELYERVKAGEPNTLTLTANAENTESMYWQFERQIGAFMYNMNAARHYASHIKGEITDGMGNLIPEATLSLGLEVENMVQASNSGTGDPGLPLIYLPLGTMTSTHESTYNVRGGIYDWSVVPSVQPYLEGFPIPAKPYTVTATANGRYSDQKNVMVSDYREVVNDQNFVLAQAISADFTFTPDADPDNNVTVLFLTYNRDGTPFIGEVSAELNNYSVSIDGDIITGDTSIMTISRIAANGYSLKFNLDDLRSNTITDAVLTLKIETQDAYSPLVAYWNSLGEVDPCAGGHDYIDDPDDDDYIAPACTEPGFMPAKCSVCGGAGEGNVLEAIGHDYEMTERVDATCEDDGYEHWVCRNDDRHFYDVPLAATSHDWGEWTVTTPATCTAPGIETRVCANNPAHTETRPGEIDPDAHAWGEWTVTAPATCTAPGIETRVCANNPAHTETRPGEIDPDAHAWGEWTVTAPATCTAPGIETRVCANNPAHTETRLVPLDPNAHAWGEWTVTAPATCTAPGIETRICANNPAHTETRLLPLDPTGHTWVAADCETPRTCTVCFETDGLPLGHAWGEWTVTTPATCTAPGVETRVCGNNTSHTQTRDINRLEHIEGAGVITKPATREEEGVITFYCQVCGVVLRTVVIPKLQGPPENHEFLQEIAPDILRNGLTASQLRLTGNTLTLVIDGREFVLSNNADNRNISGEIDLGDGYYLIFDIKGNGSNIKAFEIVKR